MNKKINWDFVILNTLSLCMFSYLIFIGGKADKIARSSEVFYINIALFSIIAVYLFYLTVVGKITYTDTPFYGLLIAFYLIAGLSIISADNTWVSITEYYLWGLYLILLIGLLKIKSIQNSREQLLTIFLLIGFLFIFGKLFVSFQWLITWFQNNQFDFNSILKYRPSSPNISAALTNIFIFLAGTKILYVKEADNESLFRKILYVVIALSGVTLLWISSSRGALIGFLGGISLTGLLISVRVYRNRKKRMTNLLWKSMAGLIVIVPSTYFLYRGLLDFSRAGLSVRLLFWTEALKIFRSNPLTGVGIYGTINYIPGIFSTPPSEIHNHFHSIFLTILAELGLPGLLLFLALSCLIISRYIKEYLRNRNINSLAVVGVLGSLFAHGLFDTLYVEPVYTFALLITIGLTLPNGPENGNVSVSVPGIRFSVGLILATIFILGVLLGYQRVPLVTGIEYSSDDLVKSVAYFTEALERAPGSSLVNQQLGLVYSNLAEEDPGNDNYMTEAIKHFRNCTQYDPGWAMNYANLGSLLADVGKFHEAEELLETAIKLAPESALISLNLAIVAEKAGDLQIAKEAYLSYLRLKRSNSLGPFWDQTEVRKEVRDQIEREIFPEDFSQVGEDELLAMLKEEPINGILRLYLAKTLFDKGKYLEAKKEAKNASLIGLKGGGELEMELLWLEAEIAVNSTDMEEGIDKGTAALSIWQKQTSRGPGTLGGENYGNKKYINPVLQGDLVPQIVNEPLPGEWIQRMGKLEEWCQLIEINCPLGAFGYK